MSYKVGQDGILTWVDDEESTPKKKPASGKTTTTAATATTTRRPTTTTTTSSTSTSTRRRRSIDFGATLTKASSFLMGAAVVLAAATLFVNHGNGVAITDYFVRLWHNIVAIWRNLDPFYGLSIVEYLPWPPPSPIDAVDDLILGGEFIGLAFNGLGWLVGQIPVLLETVFESLGLLLGLLFGFLA